MRAYIANIVLKLGLMSLIGSISVSCSHGGAGGAQYNPGLHVRQDAGDKLAKVSVVDVVPVTYDQNAAFLFAAEEKPEELVRSLVSRYASLNLKDVSVEELQQEDSVLKVHVLRGSERLGGRIGADRGAMILLKVELRDANSNTPLWISDYYYKDQPLSDNLFDLEKRTREKKQAGFLSFRELFSQGVKESLLKLNERREQLRGSGKLQ